MKYTIQSLALASIASARVLHNRQSSCCFGLDASGDGVEGGSLGQLSDGQNRFGPGQSGATYCINNGQITDKAGRGCVVTSPTNQWQCDQGASPTGGFSLSSSGQLSFEGSDQFYACPVDDNGNYNIYTQPIDNMPKCVEVNLNSSNGSCAAPSSAPASSPAAPATPSVSVSTASCEASTVVKTVTQQNNVTVPVTHYRTVPVTNYQTVPTTIYHTQEETTTLLKTEELTTTAVRTEEQTTTAIRTEEQTTTQQAPPVTEEVTQKTTVQKPTTVEQPTTVVQTTSVQQPPVTEEVTQKTTIEQPTTIQQPPVTETTSFQQPPVTQTDKVTTTASSSASPSASSGSGCPLDLPSTDSYLKPRLIIPVNQNQPDKAYGTQYNAYVGSGNSTIFSFDIPQSYSGKTCDVVFSFPKQSQLETSFVSESGNGGIDFKMLKDAADKSTTFNNQPGVAQDFGVKDVSTGNAYKITSGECKVGQTVSYELTATGDREIALFQDYNPCANGLWIIAN